MKFPRTSGIILHPSSLPGAYGIGDFGEEAYRFVDFLKAGSQHLWQMLPLTPTGFGDSPYQGLSAFAGNTLLISPQKLVEDGFLDEADLEPLPRFTAEKVMYSKVIEYKQKILEIAFEKFKNTTNIALRSDCLSFCQKESDWLLDYCLFRVLKEEHGGTSWDRWEGALVERDKHALEQASERLQEKIDAEKFFQYLFYRQWNELKQYANKNEVSIIGDMPIFVAYDSADVWVNRQLFKLDESGQPTSVAGVPPDYFSATGQLWGNPLYDWEALEAQGFSWWLDRMKALMTAVDIVRIDHFRGFAACWEIPAAERTAQRGRWVEAPGHKLFTTLKEKLGSDLPIIVEDLGVITPDVEELRDAFGFPGMRVLQMAFCSDPGNIDLPHHYIPNCVVYTGTHDNDTAVGWFNSKAGQGSTRDEKQVDYERACCLKYLKSNGKNIHWDFIETAFSTVANVAIVPMQDVLGLGSKARMNLPASHEGNWSWRMKPDSTTDEIAQKLSELVEFYARQNAVTVPAQQLTQVLV